MLSQLTIRNFAIVDHLQVDWHPGLNVITGETGAGKSILIDAVGALLGDRLGPEIVRSGASRALVEGVFSLADHDRLPAALQAVLDEYGLDRQTVLRSGPLTRTVLAPPQIPGATFVGSESCDQC